VPKLKLAAEKVTALKLEFAKMDANKDGFITRDELVKLMPDEDPQFIDEMIKVADIQTADGKINFTEFVDA
jgi:Ca2+-binding EF-hand superfamily protein